MGICQSRRSAERYYGIVRTAALRSGITRIVGAYSGRFVDIIHVEDDIDGIDRPVAVPIAVYAET